MSTPFLINMNVWHAVSLNKAKNVYVFVLTTQHKTKQKQNIITHKKSKTNKIKKINETNSTFSRNKIKQIK